MLQPVVTYRMYLWPQFPWTHSNWRVKENPIRACRQSSSRPPPSSWHVKVFVFNRQEYDVFFTVPPPMHLLCFRGELSDSQRRTWSAHHAELIYLKFYFVCVTSHLSWDYCWCCYSMMLFCFGDEGSQRRGEGTASDSSWQTGSVVAGHGWRRQTAVLSYRSLNWKWRTHFLLFE